MTFVEFLKLSKPADPVQAAIVFFEPDNISIVKQDKKGDTWRYRHNYRDDLSPSRWLNNVPRSFWEKHIGYPLGHISEKDFPIFANKFTQYCKIGEEAIYGTDKNRCVLLASLSYDGLADFIEFELPSYNK